MKRVLSSLLVVSFLILGFLPSAQANSVTELTIQGGPISAIDERPVEIDATVFTPSQTPAPAVVLAHGFGGNKNGMRAQAEKLQAAGFVVVTYSARGFGKTVAQISMNSPQFEVADARAIVDYLASLNSVKQDGKGDPRVGFGGGSYGGALSLLVAGYDQRVDAVAADITWNSLENALFPNASSTPGTSGIFKQLWTGYFFSVGMATPPEFINQCGRFTVEWCAAYQAAFAETEIPQSIKELMAASSPSSIASRITAPTMLMQGQADSLFPLSEADATYRQIYSANPSTPLKMVWHGGGHDGGLNERDRLDELTLKWFQDHLADGEKANTDFEVTIRKGSVISNNSDQQFEIWSAPNYLDAIAEPSTLKLVGNPQKVIRPAGGVPANISVLPGFSFGGLSNMLSQPLPNQSAYFETQSVSTKANLVGSSNVTLRLSAEQPATDVTLFVSLRIVSDSGRETFPSGLVSPLRVPIIDSNPRDVDVKLPTIVQQLSPGDRLRLVVSTTDFGYQLPADGQQLTVGLADGELELATTSALQNLNADAAPITWVIGSLLGAVVIGLVSFLIRPRRKLQTRTELLNVPVQIEHLAKEFKGGHRAVNDISWNVPAGKVVGLLGPNGAGKTTTMRMIMGLIQPTDGEIFVYGERVFPGSPVLSRIGSLVEGAGFLPHLSGRENLDLYWKASGRSTEDPHLDAVLAIADLGTALDRKVKTYSQGMRQRLGIAQAMLGMPDLLMLDEPTNGLDPPQIRAMRDMLMKYVETGRTVIVSSHLLSEVEQTCSHVIVMHRGQLITTGRVDELLEGKSHMRLEDFFLDVVGDDLTIGKS